jgi:hypothetical protein
MNIPAAPERFTVLVRALPDPEGAPGIVRFRRWLKCGLRSFRLRCIGCEVVSADAGGIPTESATLPPAVAEPSEN